LVLRRDKRVKAHRVSTRVSRIKEEAARHGAVTVLSQGYQQLFRGGQNVEIPKSRSEGLSRCVWDLSERM
jgi:hypothetical protein